MVRDGVFIRNNFVDKININDPIFQINEKEFNMSLMQFGSYMSIIKNKRINQTMLLVLLLDSDETREIFKLISSIDNTQVLFYNLIIRFPVLCKSKIVKNKLKSISDDKRRKRIL